MPAELHLDATNLQWQFFSVIETLEIERMTLAERLQAMELLWRSLSAEPDKLESPAWHKKILEKRLAKIESGKGEFLTLAQLKKRLAKRLA
jgi:putative addiction module component (TIGR02574 family)